MFASAKGAVPPASGSPAQVMVPSENRVQRAAQDPCRGASVLELWGGGQFSERTLAQVFAPLVTVCCSPPPPSAVITLFPDEQLESL